MVFRRAREVGLVEGIGCTGTLKFFFLKKNLNTYAFLMFFLVCTTKKKSNSTIF